jgi:GNAT superfamily N-acetyltransferase
MSIRKAESGDWQAISRLLTQLEYPGTADFIQEKLKQLLNDPAETLLVWSEPSPNTSTPQTLSGPTPPDESALPNPEPPNHRLPPTSAAPPNAAILAFLSLHFIPQIALKGDFARISYFAVDDEARSLGIGRQLEERATRIARERGCTQMEVHCHTRRTRAQEFYARQGWMESPKYLIKRL